MQVWWDERGREETAAQTNDTTSAHRRWRWKRAGSASRTSHSARTNGADGDGGTPVDDEALPDGTDDGAEGPDDDTAATDTASSESAHAATLRDMLINEADLDKQADLVTVVNGRTTLASRFKPVELGKLDMVLACQHRFAVDMSVDLIVRYYEFNQFSRVSSRSEALDRFIVDDIARARAELEAEARTFIDGTASARAA